MFKYAEMPRHGRRGQAVCGPGGGATLTPVGFLVLSGSEVKMVKLCEQSNLEKIVDVTKDIVERFVKN